MHTVTPLDSSPNNTRLQMWNNQLTDARATIKLGLDAAEALPARSDQPWVALLAFAEPQVHWDWPCKHTDEEIVLH